ncbi:MAG: hypothetical protein JRJ59_12265, partial [Deltaproteobacteria bacterium]|nr:hypothetical protein [Deltaproteobacteria bacterium]
MRPILPPRGVRLPLARFLLAAACVAAYANSFSVPFLFDDWANILGSSSIKDLSDIGRILATPRGEFVGGRPLANLTFAVNWALSGEGVWSYHLFNLLVHTGAALLLFGLVRRTLEGPRLAPAFGRHAVHLAFFSALLWAVHPLHTQAVTYISQRFESLMGFFFLLSMYLAVRGWNSPAPRPWMIGAGAACILGMAAKEVMVAAPVVIFAYDMVFVHEKPGRALKDAAWLYGFVALAMVFLVWLVARGATATATPVPSWGPGAYLVTETRVVAKYLFLAFWPSGLSFFHHWDPATLSDSLPHVFLVGGLFAATVFALARRRPAGFLGAWFFVTLAPSSSFLPLPFFMWEYRMYLPLAALVTLAVTGAYRLAGLVFRDDPRRLG